MPSIHNCLLHISILNISKFPSFFLAVFALILAKVSRSFSYPFYPYSPSNIVGRKKCSSVTFSSFEFLDIAFQLSKNLPKTSAFRRLTWDFQDIETSIYYAYIFALLISRISRFSFDFTYFHPFFFCPLRISEEAT